MHVGKATSGRSSGCVWEGMSGRSSGCMRERLKVGGAHDACGRGYEWEEPGCMWAGSEHMWEEL